MLIYTNVFARQAGPGTPSRARSQAHCSARAVSCRPAEMPGFPSAPSAASLKASAATSCKWRRTHQISCELSLSSKAACLVLIMGTFVARVLFRQIEKCPMTSSFPLSVTKVAGRIRFCKKKKRFATLRAPLCLRFGVAFYVPSSVPLVSVSLHPSVHVFLCVCLYTRGGHGKENHEPRAPTETRAKLRETPVSRQEVPSQNVPCYCDGCLTCSSRFFATVTSPLAVPRESAATDGAPNGLSRMPT